MTFPVETTVTTVQSMKKLLKLKQL